MIRRPRRSPLFPYPPLSRSGVDRRRLRRSRRGADRCCSRNRREEVAGGAGEDLVAAVIRRGAIELADDADRSEEHTSELQSQSNLVCRLLLEKKKTINNAVP